MENNKVINKTVPSNLEAEIGILNSILIDPAALNVCQDTLNIEDFFDQKNRLIYQAVLDLKRENTVPDIQLVVSKLVEKNKFEDAGGYDYLNKVLTFSYSSQNIDSYITLVRNSALKRKTIDSLSKLSQQGYDLSLSSDAYLEAVEKEVFELTQYRQTSEFRTLAEVANTVYENTNKMAQDSGEVTGLDTGFDNLNKLTFGLQNGNLIILAARPAMGKSAYALNLAAQIAKKNDASVAVFSLEMPAEQLVLRMYAADTAINVSALGRGKLTDGDQWRILQNSKRNFANTKIYFDDSGMVTIGDIRSKCRKLKASDAGLDCVIIDYLQLITSTGHVGSKNEEVSQISRGLKLLARELNIPVIALAQLSRAVESREDKRPIMSDLRDSGSIEQDADIVCFLYREEYYTHKRPGECDLIIAKNRQGSLATLKYLFDGAIQKFTDNGKEEN
ncbi:MAG: replicative DNA helicase [Acholeplasmatales bacterium]|nr:replicative DNA helicase [Acholeplasmatales bacterium]